MTQIYLHFLLLNHFDQVKAKIVPKMGEYNEWINQLTNACDDV